MEYEDKVDNKSHSSLNFDSIDSKEAGKKRFEEERKVSENQARKEEREGGDEKERREDESEGQERGMLDEEEIKIRGEKVKREKELSMKKGGLKSGRLKRLVHPLDRSVSYVFTVTIFFTIIALISGLPILIIISSLLPITWTISYIFSCELFHKTTSWNKITASDSSSRTGLIPLTPMESYWASDGILINNYRRGIATCLLYFDQGLTLEQLKDVLIARVLSKDSMSRFRATIVYKGLSRRAFWRVIPLEKLPIDSIVIQEPVLIGSKSNLRSYVFEKMNEPMNEDSHQNFPLWNITLVRTSFNNQVILIIRVHQSVCDGIGLLSTLIEQLADQAPPSTTTFIRTCQGTMTATNSLFKPRFGGINFSVNIFRAILAGPLTVLLWILWSFTRRKNNFLQSFPFYSSPDYNNTNGLALNTSFCTEEKQEYDEEERHENEELKKEGKSKGKSGRNKPRRKRRHHHHQHQGKENILNEGSEVEEEHQHSTCKKENCIKSSCYEGKKSGSSSNSKSNKQKHSSQQLQQFDRRNRDTSSDVEERNVVFGSSSPSPHSSSTDDKVKFCKDFEQGETSMMVLVPPSSDSVQNISVVTTCQKSGGNNSVLKGGKKTESEVREKTGGKGRKLLTRAFGASSSLLLSPSSSSRIKSTTSEQRMNRMSTGITHPSISPSNSEKERGRRVLSSSSPKESLRVGGKEIKLPPGEDLLEVKPMTEHEAEGGRDWERRRNMTTRMKEVMGLMGRRKNKNKMKKCHGKRGEKSGGEKSGEEEGRKSWGGSGGKKSGGEEGRKSWGGNGGGSHKTSRFPSLSNHSSSCNSQGSKSSSHGANISPPLKKLSFNYSLSPNTSQSTNKFHEKKKREENELDSLCDPIKSIHWSSVDLTKVYRVKQVTRSCLNDVVLAAISGSIRDYLVKYSGVDYPPNLAFSIPVDVRVINDSESSSNKSGGGFGGSGMTGGGDGNPAVSFVMLTSPLPTRTEGAIPRMWEVKQLTDEIKASPDSVVMYGSHFYFYSLFPSFVGRSLINLIHRNSSVSVSNLQGPPMNITVNSHQLHSIQYFMSVPPTIPVTFNVITYGHKLFVSITTTSILIPSAKLLFNLFSNQIDLLADLLSKRRIPGESRSKKRPHHVIIEAPIGSRISGGLSPITAYSSAPFSTKQLLDRLHHVQYEVNRLNEALDEDCPDADAVNDRLSELKAEFGHLVKQIRRRKSIAEYGHNIVFSSELEDVDDDGDDDDDDIDMDGEMRPLTQRRFSFVGGVSGPSVGRRPSLVSALSSFGGSSSSIMSGKRSPGTATPGRMTASSSTSLEPSSHASYSQPSSSSGHTFPQSLASRYKRFSLTPSTTFGGGGRGASGGTGATGSKSHHHSPSDTLSFSPCESKASPSFRSESIV